MLSVKKIIVLCFSWKIFLLIIVLLVLTSVSLQMNFLGGGLENYLKAPYLWSWANFDGEHFLSVAQFGYGPYLYFFFPLYPLLIRFTALFFVSSAYRYLITGLLISFVSLVIAIIGLWKLFRERYDRSTLKTAIIILLLFPTSFYFGSVYSESLFLALSVWTFYFARRNKWLPAAILTSFASVTRVVGIALILALIAEAYISRKEGKSKLKDLWPVLLSPVGIFIYMLYLLKVTGDPFAFFHEVTIFGQQRQSAFILLPQVFYRYLFKVLPVLDYSYFPTVFSTYLEFITAIIFLVLLIVMVFKMRLSYVIYSIFTYIIPTLSGSFSSMSRYVLIIFPAFVLAASYLRKTNPVIRRGIYLLLLTCLVISVILFTRGFWVA